MDKKDHAIKEKNGKTMNLDESQGKPKKIITRTVGKKATKRINCQNR
jgi:hypothetical protein